MEINKKCKQCKYFYKVPIVDRCAYSVSCEKNNDMAEKDCKDFIKGNNNGKH